MVKKYNLNQSTSQARSSSCQCSTTLYGMQKEKMNYVQIIQRQVEQYARKSPRGHRFFSGPGSEEKWYGTYDHKPDGSWDRTAEKMLLTFAETEHPVFRGTSALGERRIKKQSKMKNINTLMAVRKTLNCFSRWSSPSISSLFTEQWQI